MRILSTVFICLFLMIVVGCKSKQAARPVVEESVVDQEVSEQVADEKVDRSGRYTLDAMIGQVNGKALYANSVLEPIDEQLSTLGEQLSRSAFRMQAKELVMGRLQGILFDTMMLGEAEGELTPEEHGGLANILGYQREEMLRKFGQGSTALADSAMREQTGKGLDQTLRERRQQILTQIYVERKLKHKVNVTRKDVERYYRDHFDEFNSPGKRTLRLIQVSDPRVADEIKARLDGGEAFVEVVKHPANSRWSKREYEVVGDEHFGEKLDALNKAMVELEVGEYSQRMDIGGASWWVYVQEFEAGEGKSFQDVQLDIEAHLFNMQWRKLTRDYRQELLAKQDMSELDKMAVRLLEITMNRYAKPVERVEQ